MDKHTGCKWSTTTNASRTISCEAWNYPVEYPKWGARYSTMLNSIFWKKVQGQNILGGEGLQNAKLLMTKCCLKQIAMVTSILVLLVYISESKAQLMMAFNKGTAHSPKRVLKTVMGCSLTNTKCVCIYASYNQNSYRECIRIYRYVLTQSFWTEQRPSGGNTPSNPQVSVSINS